MAVNGAILGYPTGPDASFGALPSQTDDDRISYLEDFGELMKGKPHL